MGGELLRIEDLKVHYFTSGGVVRAVDGVDLEVRRGELVGLVGESGSGKSTLGLAIPRLIPPPGKIVGGRIVFDGLDLTELSEERMRDIRGRRIGMVFQDPMTSLDPLMKVGDQISETILAHEDVSKSEARARAEELLEAVGIPRDRYDDYPHQFSGGMRQRVMIASAIALKPDLLIADEPTTALDVIVQAQILHLFRELQRSMGMSVILITHDMALEMQVADRIAVMYGGWIVEYSPAVAMARDPLNPYTAELLKAIPNIELEDQRLVSIPGSPPDLRAPPPGCRFHPRCRRRFEPCATEEPATVEVDGRLVKCHLYASGGPDSAGGSERGEGERENGRG